MPNKEPKQAPKTPADKATQPAPVDQPQGPERREFPLPSGRVAAIRQGKGRDFLAAMRAAGEQEEMPVHLAARLTLIDGQPVVGEDLLDGSMDDMVALMSQPEAADVFLVKAGLSLTPSGNEAGQSESMESSASPETESA